ncbi:Satratoxin biosynthesis SC1 cluster protein [Lachnellula suecica]|uniref:Satratoxin biosynthesis SC1 cluster protein n=1 Tax=Lachnellula suecica TaxID=602035 RepID=A0A8T9CJZ5_9HELO|nr:Satratoxin biosynthesis SC1 cluster protein [Lachnellula suecica]
MAVIVPSIVFTTLALFSVIARLVARILVLRIAGRDEAAIIAAMICSLALLVATVGETSRGLGRHESEINQKDAQDLRKYLFTSVVFYHATLGLTKTSIIFQYLRVFYDTPIRIACWAVLTIVSFYSISAVSTSIFTCRPVAAFWDKSIEGDCFKTGGFLYFFHPSFNILTDLVLITLPLPMLSTLSLPRKQKIGLMLVFTLGGFVCVVSIVRLYSVVVSVKSNDLSFTNTSIALWSIIEANVGIICASLPTIRPLLVRYLPCTFSRRETSNLTTRTVTGSDFELNRAPNEFFSQFNDDGSAHGILSSNGTKGDAEKGQ